MQLTQSTLLSKFKSWAGVLSVAFLASSCVSAQDNFDFSSLPQQDAQTNRSEARIIAGEVQVRQVEDRAAANSMQQPQTVVSPHQATPVSQTVTEMQGDIMPVGHLTTHGVSQPTPTRLYRLANCDWRQFEYNLIQMWIHQPQVEALQEGQIMRVQIPTPDSRTASTMLINRKDSTLYFEGEDNLIASWNEVMRELDREQAVNDVAVQLISTAGLDNEQLQKVSYMIRMKQQENDDTMRAVQLPGATQDPQDAEVGGPVEARIIPGISTLLLKGNQQDVEELERQIADFMKAAQASLPQPKRIDLANADPTQAAETIQQLYDNQLADSQGPASITPIQNPKGLLVVAKGPALKLIEGIIKELDKEPGEQVPGTIRDFKVYRLKHMSAIDAKQRVDEYFNQATQQGVSDPGAPENVLTIADPRTNLLLVKATKSYIEKIDLFLAELDVADTEATREIRVIKLKNTLATQMAPVIQYAINGGTAFAPSQSQQAQAQQPPQNLNQGGVNTSQAPQTTLQMMTVDRQGNQVRSGILIDVQITADEGSNSLIVRAPADGLPLIEALIARLDVVPDVETQIKVFQILNGEALTLLNMLNTLFGGDAQGGGGQGNAVGGVNSLPLQSATTSDGQSLANLRFTLDERTNSIIASGPVGDLEVVKNLLTRLDEEDVNRRQVTVVRLNNAYAVDVSDAINEWLDARTNLVSNNFQSPFVANKREVIVVPETVSNSLIISALPRYYGDVLQVITNLDRRPPMVKVKVLLAEVNLNALEEFGMEVGVQDSLLFDRGQSLANPLSTATLTTGENLAGTARAAFGVGTVSSNAGFGGFTLSAGNESINLLLRSLKNRSCLRVLSRPQLMTIENLQGRITVGSNVPRVTGTTVTNGIAQTNVTPINVGVTLEVTPRVSPDGMIVMFVNAVNSQLADAGIVVGTDINGNAIESPIINQTEAQTTVMGRSGQTIVFSGLIQETKSTANRGVPILSGLPVVGPFFGFQSDEASRTELLIIMTPYLVTDDESLRQQNNEEMARMHWCMCDVTELYGSTGYDGNQSFSNSTETYYPDMDPSGLSPIQGQPQFEMQSPSSNQSLSPQGFAPGTQMEVPQSNNQLPAVGSGIQAAGNQPNNEERRGLFRFAK